jgi:general transcription factor 3C polypeptide 5 (transcription factor C subunit 1)
MADRGPPPRKKQRRPLPARRPPPEPEPALAPEFEIGTREVVAVEHPAIIQNLDNGIKTFGDNQPFERVSSSTVAAPFCHALVEVP